MDLQSLPLLVPLPVYKNCGISQLAAFPVYLGKGSLNAELSFPIFTPFLRSELAQCFGRNSLVGIWLSFLLVSSHLCWPILHHFCPAQIICILFRFYNVLLAILCDYAMQTLHGRCSFVVIAWAPDSQCLSSSSFTYTKYGNQLFNYFDVFCSCMIALDSMRTCLLLHDNSIFYFDRPQDLNIVFLLLSMPSMPYRFAKFQDEK